MTDRLEQQLDFILATEALRTVFRQSPVLNTGRKENSAEHSWHVALMAWLLAEHANEPVDASKVMVMILLHDLGEIDAGDVFAYDEAAREAHHEQEQACIVRLAALLPDDQGEKLLALWEEFEEAETSEARFARSLDALQPMLLNYHSEGGTWREHDVYEAKVTAVKSPIAEGSETLWSRAKRLIADAVDKGFLKT